MSRAKLDEDVIRAAMHLEFVANTVGPSLDGSFSDLLTDMIIYDMAGGDCSDYVLKERRKQLDEERRARIRGAWERVRHAIEIRQAALSEHDDVVEIQVVAVETHDTLSGKDVIKLALHNPSSPRNPTGHLLILDSDAIFDPIELKVGDMIQVRKK